MVESKMLWYLLILTVYFLTYTKYFIIPDCFLIINNTQSHIESNITKKFENYYQDFTKCVNVTNSDDLCSQCLKDYDVLHNYFNQISDINEKISYCMDIVDIVSKTDIF